MFDWESIGNLVLLFVAVMGAFGAALWLSLILWTFRDIRKRSRDPFAQILATAVITILNLPGLVVYLILRPPETLAEAYERSLEEEALLQSIEEKAICPGCGRTVRDSWQVCPYCHTKLKKVCITCSELLELGWNICPHCASSQLGYAAEPAAPLSAGSSRSSAPTAARRLSTADDASAHAGAQAPTSVPRRSGTGTALYPDEAYTPGDDGVGDLLVAEPTNQRPQRERSQRDRRASRRRTSAARTDAVQYIEDDDF